MVSMDEVNEEADKAFAPFVVDGIDGGPVVLRDPIRLSQKSRDELASVVERVRGSGGDTEVVVRSALDTFLIVADGDGGQRLVDALDEDPIRTINLLRLYQKWVRPGEASDSES